MKKRKRLPRISKYFSSVLKYSPEYLPKYASDPPGFGAKRKLDDLDVSLGVLEPTCSPFKQDNYKKSRRCVKYQ